MQEMEITVQICTPYPQFAPAANFIFFLENTLYISRLTQPKCGKLNITKDKTIQGAPRIVLLLPPPAYYEYK